MKPLEGREFGRVHRAGDGRHGPETACFLARSAPYSAQGTGPPPWHVYRLRIATVFCVRLGEPHAASRWRF
jgi:hypothetical protein